MTVLPLAYLLLLSIFISISGQLVTAAGQLSPCQGPNIPALKLVALGVHVNSLDLTSLDWTTEENNGLGKDIFEFTCAENRTWTRQDDNGSVFNLPDQVDLIKQLNASNPNVDSFLGKRNEFFVKRRCDTMGLPFNEFAFIESESIQQIDGQLYTFKVSVAEVRSASH